jgi:hypothetical protein
MDQRSSATLQGSPAPRVIGGRAGDEVEVHLLERVTTARPAS